MGSNRSVVMLGVAVLLFSVQVSWAQGESKTADADSASIQQVFTDFDENFSGHVAHGTAMTFAEDADFTNMYGFHLHGRKAIEERFTALFTGNLRAAHRTDAVKSIRFLAPGLASVDADTVITGTKAADGSDIPVRKGLMIVVMTKENSRWQISIFHEAEFPATPAPVLNTPANKPAN
ncbi:MAG: SgcJ/EcaC family oxidoreductase [Candidatus Acidiferrales bacterium]